MAHLVAWMWYRPYLEQIYSPQFGVRGISYTIVYVILQAFTQLPLPPSFTINTPYVCLNLLF